MEDGTEVMVVEVLVVVVLEVVVLEVVVMEDITHTHHICQEFQSVTQVVHILYFLLVISK